MKAYLGTSGYSYAEWKGSFYPEKLPNKDMLAFYSKKLGTVEINNTFYRMPRTNVLQGWAEQTPESFRFTIKASRRISHFKKLKDCGELLEYLLGGVAVLGGRRGPMLIQLPPTMKADAPLLRDFLQALRAIDEQKRGPAEPLLAAFEFRHPSWFEDNVYDTLRDGGATLVSGDLDESEKDPPLVKTADFAYLRLRKSDYEDRDLDAWAQKLRELGVEQVFAYFKHEARGPELALRLRERFDPS